MSRTRFFIIGAAVIFVLERALPALTFWPFFIFPVFVILFMLVSKDDARDLSYIAVTSIIFDFFSGFSFGFFTLIILAVLLAIFIFKTRFNVKPNSFFSLAVYYTIFTFAYFALITIKSDLKPLITQAPVIIAEMFLVFVIFVLISQYQHLNHGEFKQV